MKLLLLLVVVVVVVAVVCEAQRNNTRRTRQRGAARRSRRTTRPPARRGNTGNRRRGSASGSASSGRRRNGARGNRRRQPHASCEEIYLPMCKGLVPYTHTKLPNRYNHTTQQQVYRVLEHKWAHMDQSCSKNLRLMICSMYLPKCHGAGSGLEACKATCMTARRRCMRSLKQGMGVTWGDTYSCRNLPRRRCVRQVTETPCQYEHPQCLSNSAIPVCANLTFTWGTVPNMFQQCHTQEIQTEVAYFNPLRATNCHAHLDFFLCGVYSPFCVRSEVPFTFPCRELCDQIRTSCEADYERLYHGLPWPNKLQCHRYPATDTEGYQCVMPNEGSNFAGGR